MRKATNSTGPARTEKNRKAQISSTDRVGFARRPCILSSFRAGVASILNTASCICVCVGLDHGPLLLCKLKYIIQEQNPAAQQLLSQQKSGSYSLTVKCWYQVKVL